MFDYSIQSVNADVLLSKDGIQLEDVIFKWAGGVSHLTGMVRHNDNQMEIEIVGRDQSLYALGKDMDMSLTMGEYGVGFKTGSVWNNFPILSFRANTNTWNRFKNCSR